MGGSGNSDDQKSRRCGQRVHCLGSVQLGQELDDGPLPPARSSLPVVKVGTADLNGRPAAHIQLVVNADGLQQIVADQTHELVQFGYAETTGLAGPDLGVPRQVTSWITDWVRDQLGPDDVLWLHLVKPYGALGAVPWERHLQPEIGIPLLRLPDALPDPDRSGSRFHVALCATAPVEKGASTAVQMGPQVARALVEGLGERLRLHVFVDLESQPSMAAELSYLPIQTATIHRPEVVAEAVDRSNGLRNPKFVAKMDPPGNARHHPRRRPLHHPWLHPWIRGRDPDNTLANLFHPPLSTGCPVGSYGCPCDQSRGTCRRFHPPDGNYSDYALRRVVDELESDASGSRAAPRPRDGPGDE